MSNSIIYLSTAYLAPITYYSALAKANKVFIESHCHYVKQTYRNRCIIASANGTQVLSIPIERSESLKCLTRDVRIAEHGNWRHLHWNAIISAYNSTPFFEYYEDDFCPFYKQKFDFLFDFNESLRELICRLIGIHPLISCTSSYKTEFAGHELNWREEIHPKKRIEQADYKPYYQIFDGKFGFQPNLSIIDLLFNMGPESVLFL